MDKYSNIIDSFLHNLYDNTNIISSFDKDKEIMKIFFNELLNGDDDNIENMLLMIYLVLYMKNQLNNVDKNLSDHIYKIIDSTSIVQAGGHLGNLRRELLKSKQILPFAFNSIYYKYITYKIRNITEMLKNGCFLDEILKAPIINTNAIVTYDELDFLNIYYAFYNKLMNFVKDKINIFENDFRNNNIIHIYRFYFFRRLLELDILDKGYIEKNDILRDNISNYTTGTQVLSVYYKNINEDNLINNIVDGLRTKVNIETPLLVNVLRQLNQVLLKNTDLDSETEKKYIKTLQKFTNKLEYKKTGGVFLKLTQNADIDKFIVILNKVLYVILRTADTIHDFIMGTRTSPDFKNKINLSDIKFITKNEDGLEAEMTYLDILNDLNTSPIFDNHFYFDKNEDDLTNDINLGSLENSMNAYSNFETNIMHQINSFIYKVSKLHPAIKENFLNIYRPSNKILENILNNIDVTSDDMNKAYGIKKSDLFDLEQQIFNPTDIPKIFNKVNVNESNLLFVIYDESVITPGKVDSRRDIINNVKNFVGSDTAKLSVDFQSSSSTFFKIFTIDDNKNKLFVRPERVYAEIWDPATNKNIKNIPKISTTQEINDLLDINQDNTNIPICEKTYTIKLKQINGRLVADAGIILDDVMDETDTDSLEIENADTYRRFTPSVSKIANLIFDSSNPTERCKLYCLKNSGDWGEVASAKQNKTFLLTEDKLCSYYSILTNTCTIYTINRGNKYITIIHKGLLEVSWKDIIHNIKTNLKNLNYFLFFTEIIISLEVEDPVYKLYYYIKYDLRNKDNIVITLSEQKTDIVGSNPVLLNVTYPETFPKEYKDLKKITLTKISFTHFDIITYPIVLEDTQKIVMKDISVGKKDIKMNIDLKLIENLNTYRSVLFEKNKSEFLLYTQAQYLASDENYNDYDTEIYSDFFNTHYTQMMTPPSDLTGLKNIITLHEFVKNKTFQILSDNILKIYILSVSNEIKGGYNILKKYFNDLYQTISYSHKQKILQWNDFRILEPSPKPYEVDLVEKIQITSDDIQAAVAILKDAETEKNLAEKKLNDIKKSYFKNIKKIDILRLITDKNVTAEVQELIVKKEEEEQEIKRQEINVKKLVKIYETVKSKTLQHHTILSFGSKIYKEYRFSKSIKALVYYMEYYNYSIEQKETITPELLCFTNILTNGLWEIFGINPFIYSIFMEVLNKKLETIPVVKNTKDIRMLKMFYYNTRSQMNKLKGFTANIIKSELPETSFNDRTELKELIENLESQIETLETDLSKITNIEEPREIYIEPVLPTHNVRPILDNLKTINLDELRLFIYIYDLIIPTDTSKFIVFDTLTTTKESIKSSNPYGTTLDIGKSAGISFFKIEQPFIKSFFKMLYKMTRLDINQDLKLFLTNNTPLSLIFKKYFSEIIESSTVQEKVDFTNIDTVIEEYVQTLKPIIDDLTIHSEYYSKIIDILKIVKNTLDDNQVYLEPTMEYKHTVQWFMFMIDSYLDNYNSILENKKIDLYQYYHLSRYLLVTIKSQLENTVAPFNDIPIIKNIKTLLEKALDVDVLPPPKTIVRTLTPDENIQLKSEIDRLNRLIDIHNIYTPVNSNVLEEKEVHFEPLDSAKAVSSEENENEEENVSDEEEEGLKKVSSKLKLCKKGGHEVKKLLQELMTRNNIKNKKEFKKQITSNKINLPHLCNFLGLSNNTPMDITEKHSRILDDKTTKLLELIERYSK
jgi:hypothetical protein